MAGNEQQLTPWQAEAYRMAIPQLLRSAFYGEDLSASEVSIADMGRQGAAQLCCPLTSKTLRRIHRSSSVSWQDADVAYVPDEEAERSGRLIFRVSYDFDGCDAAGTPFTVREKAVVAVTCRPSQRSPFRKELCISNVALCTEHDGHIQLPESPSRARMRLARRSSAGQGRRFAGCCIEGVLEVLGEIVSEVIFEVIDGIFDGL